MLKEALQALAKQAVDAAAPQVLEIDPTRTWAHATPDGKIELIGNQAPWRRHQARDLLTITLFAERFKATSCIWHSRKEIVCLIDDGMRRDRITVEMLLSTQIKALADLEAKKPMLEHRQFLFMLRTVFTQAAFTASTGFIDLLRTVQFKTNAEAGSNIQRGKSSIGKTLNVEASGLEAVPEQVRLSVPIFENDFARVARDIQCAVEIYEGEQRFQFFPLPGEIERAIAAQEQAIGGTLYELLETKQIPVYYGDPR